MALHPCPQCARHVRHTAPNCPFCEAALAPMSGEVTQIYSISRAAIMAGMVTLAACDQQASSTQSTQLPTTTTPAVSVDAASSAQLLPTQVNPLNNQPSLFPQPGLDPTAVPGTTPSPFLNGTQIAPPSGPQDIGAQARRYGGPPRPMTPTAPTTPPNGPNDPGAAVSRYGAPSPIDELA